MGRLEKSQWGHNINNELKYTYEKAYKEAEVKNISMSKEEFDKYIKELEVNYLLEEFEQIEGEWTWED